MENTLEQDFGKYLKSLRKERGFTLREVESKAKISNAYLSQLERGERNIPTIRILSKLAKVYGVSLTSLAEKVENIDASIYLFNLPSPDSQFVTRSYDSLSEENKTVLLKFLKYLVKEDQQ